MAIFRTQRIYAETLGGNKVASSKIMNTRLGLGFDKHRKYDTDLDRLGRMGSAQRELHKPGQIRDELRKMHNELNGSI
jgi:hypothetical protein